MADGYKTVTFANGHEVTYKTRCDHCDRYLTRCRTGPTGRKHWTLRVDACRWSGCGSLYPAQDLTPDQENWVERWNRRVRKGFDSGGERFEPYKPSAALATTAAISTWGDWNSRQE